MMISDRRPREAFVWIWLSGAIDPVVAGRLEVDDAGSLTFGYGRSYLGRADAIPIYAPELPLQRGGQRPSGFMTMPSSIRDASPDAWGRRVIINRLTGRKGSGGESALDELVFLLESGSDRIGALDFQESATEYVPRLATNATLDELEAAVERIEAGEPLPPALELAINHGTSIGGARPKALIDAGDAKHIAKFSASGDTYSVVKAEFVAMRLAKLAGLDVAPVRLTRAARKDVLLVERFDRVRTGSAWGRKALVSALTLLDLDEMMARYASYEDLAAIISRRFDRPAATRRELFGRIAFNILAGNTDDHARNHAAFWNGTALSLTPAYDMCPQPRTGREASQAMLITGENRSSRLSSCLAAAPVFGVAVSEAIRLMEGQLETIRSHWREVCEEAELTETDRRLFMGRQFLNPYAFDDLSGSGDALKRLASEIQATG